MKGLVAASGVAKMDVIKGAGVRLPAPKDHDYPDFVRSVSDPDVLRRLAQERHIAFHPAATVERMKRRLIEG